MARLDAQANRIADAVLALLQPIDKVADDTKWLTTPKTKRREFLVAALAIESKPALAVEVLNVADTRGGAGIHELGIQIGVHIVVEGGEGAEKLINAVAADVMFALSQDETLGGLVNNWTESFTYTPQTEIMLARGGLGIATVSFTVVPLRWDHTTANPS